MPDKVDTLTRSRMMAGIRSKNTKPELIVRRYLHKRGLRFKLHVKKLPGTPDLVFPKYRKVVNVHGCFWHKHSCKNFVWPKSRADFWATKISGNVIRDQRNVSQLKEMGWKSLTIWECELNSRELERLIAQIKEPDVSYIVSRQASELR